MREHIHSKTGKMNTLAFFCTKKRVNARIVILAVILLAGIFCGSVWQRASAHNSYSAYFAQQYLTVHRSEGFLSIVSAAFFSYILIATVVLFFSFSCIGSPILFGIAACYGVSIGLIVSYLYSAFGLRGLLANMLLFLIPHMIAACSLVCFLDVGIAASSALFYIHMKGCVSSGTSTKINACFRSFLITLCGMFAAAFIKGALCAVFAPVLLK